MDLFTSNKQHFNLIGAITIGLMFSPFSLANTEGSAITPYIINGNQAQISHYPYMGLLTLNFLDQSSPNVVTFCGGTLLNEHYVLTAAHCLYASTEEKKEELERLEVAFNIETISSDIFVSNNRYQASEIYYPDTYNNTTLDDDVAIIKLRNPVDLNLIPAASYVKLAPSETYRQPDFPFTLIGYGKIAPDAYVSAGSTNQSDTLKEVSVTYLEPMECESSFADTKISEHQICITGPIMNQLRSGGCQGDSGGPLLFSEGGQLYQAGIVSFGPDFCGRPDIEVQSVFTEVFDYQDWIASVLNGTETAKQKMTATNNMDNSGSDSGGGGSLGWLTMFMLIILEWKRRSNQAVL